MALGFVDQLGLYNFKVFPGYRSTCKIREQFKLDFSNIRQTKLCPEKKFYMHAFFA